MLKKIENPVKFLEEEEHRIEKLDKFYYKLENEIKIQIDTTSKLNAENTVKNFKRLNKNIQIAKIRKERYEILEKMYIDGEDLF